MIDRVEYSRLARVLMAWNDSAPDHHSRSGVVAKLKQALFYCYLYLVLAYLLCHICTKGLNCQTGKNEVN